MVLKWKKMNGREHIPSSVVANKDRGRSKMADTVGSWLPSSCTEVARAEESSKLAEMLEMLESAFVMPTMLTKTGC